MTGRSRSTVWAVRAGIALAVLAGMLLPDPAEAAIVTTLSATASDGTAIRSGAVVRGAAGLAITVSSTSALKDVELVVRGTGKRSALLPQQEESFHAGPWRASADIRRYTLQAKWDTVSGTPPLPNGVYDIRVTVTPWTGASATASLESLTVDNPPSVPVIRSAEIWDNRPRIRWDGVAENDVGGYDLQRLEVCGAQPVAGCGTYATVASRGPLAVSYDYLDSRVARGRRYQYRLVAWRPSVVSKRLETTSEPTSVLEVTGEPGSKELNLFLARIITKPGESFFLLAQQAQKPEDPVPSPSPSRGVSSVAPEPGDILGPAPNVSPEADRAPGPTRRPAVSPGSGGSPPAGSTAAPAGPPSPQPSETAGAGPSSGAGSPSAGPTGAALPTGATPGGGAVGLPILLGAIAIVAAAGGALWWSRRGR